jgi:hypothetical protein
MGAQRSQSRPSRSCCLALVGMGNRGRFSMRDANWRSGDADPSDGRCTDHISADVTTLLTNLDLKIRSGNIWLCYDGHLIFEFK